MTTAQIPGDILANELHAWLSGVPASSCFEAARAFAGYLAALDRAGVPSAERLRLLDTLTARAQPALRDLGTMYLGSPQPLQKQAREALAIAATLLLALARGYKRVALENSTDASGRKTAPLLLAAMRHVAEAMRASYATYSRIPRGAWLEMHALYLRAEEAGIAEGVADAQSRASVAGLYCEALLIALADPYRLGLGELAAVEGILRELRARPSIGREAPESPAASHFHVPCAEDAPPRPIDEAKDRAAGPGSRVLDANAVVDALREGGERGSAPQGDLLARLAALWASPPKRALRREPAQGSVAICVGVKPIAHFVANDATVDAEGEQAALRQGLTMPLRALPQDESGPIPIHEWAVVNASAGGVCVRRSASTAYPVSVGEVVGIRSPGKASWTIGVTRWVTGVEDGTLDFGVQFFADAVCAVWVRDPAPAAPRRLGLLVADAADNAEEALLTPPDTWSDAGEFELRGEGFRSRVRAAKLVESSRCFELFRVVPS